MNKDLNNTAVKLENETQAKAAIELFKLDGFVLADGDLEEGDYVVSTQNGEIYLGKFLQNHDDKLITLDQLAWDYGLAPEWANNLMLHPQGEVCWHDGISKFKPLADDTDWMSCTGVGDFKSTSTRPKQKLQNGEEVKENVELHELLTTHDVKQVKESRGGAGLPTVGVKYSVPFQSGDNYIDATVAYHKINDSGMKVTLCFNDKRSFWCVTDDIKPLPTPEEVEREGFVKEFKKDFVGFGNFILKNKDMNPDDHMPAFFYELGYRKTK